MQPVNWENIKLTLQKYVLNKYVLTLLIFAFIFIFVGEQSLLKDIQRSHKILQTEQDIQDAETAIDVARRQLNSLQQQDSLEKFAREHYLMHKDNEEIFLVDEE